MTWKLVGAQEVVHEIKTAPMCLTLSGLSGSGSEVRCDVQTSWTRVEPSVTDGPSSPSSSWERRGGNCPPLLSQGLNLSKSTDQTLPSPLKL